MTVEVRLFAGLRKYLPPGTDRASTRMDMPRGATIRDVLGQLGIPLDAVHMTLLEGAQESDIDRRIEDGCTLSVFPAVAGG